MPNVVFQQHLILEALREEILEISLQWENLTDTPHHDGSMG